EDHQDVIEDAGTRQGEKEKNTKTAAEHPQEPLHVPPLPDSADRSHLVLHLTSLAPCTAGRNGSLPEQTAHEADLPGEEQAEGGAGEAGGEADVAYHLTQAAGGEPQRQGE